MRSCALPSELTAQPSLSATPSGIAQPSLSATSSGIAQPSLNATPSGMWATYEKLTSSLSYKYNIQ